VREGEPRFLRGVVCLFVVACARAGRERERCFVFVVAKACARAPGDDSARAPHLHGKTVFGNNPEKKKNEH
jgi:hypothetical protein